MSHLTSVSLAAFLPLIGVFSSASAQDTTPLEDARLSDDERIRTPIGNIELTDNYLVNDASRRLFDEMDFQRACQCYLWSTPLVSMATWRDRQTDVLRRGSAMGELMARNIQVNLRYTQPYRPGTQWSKSLEIQRRWQY